MHFTRQIINRSLQLFKSASILPVIELVLDHEVVEINPPIFRIPCSNNIAFLFFCLWADGHIRANAKGKLYNSLSEIPANDVGLVLGTSKYLRGDIINYLRGDIINPYFKKRIIAAAD